MCQILITPGKIMPLECLPTAAILSICESWRTVDVGPPRKDWWLYWCLIDVVTNYHNCSGLKTPHINYCRFWRPEVQNGSHRLKIKVSAGLVPWKLKRTTSFPAFPAREASTGPRMEAPFLLQSQWSLYSCFCLHQDLCSERLSTSLLEGPLWL